MSANLRAKGKTFWAPLKHNGVQTLAVDMDRFNLSYCIDFQVRRNIEMNDTLEHYRSENDVLAPQFCDRLKLNKSTVLFLIFCTAEACPVGQVPKVLGY